LSFFRFYLCLSAVNTAPIKPVSVVSAPRNPFDVPRSKLISEVSLLFNLFITINTHSLSMFIFSRAQLTRLRALFLSAKGAMPSLHPEEVKHAVPISSMGDYVHALKAYQVRIGSI
jgi:hypothetical protein